MHKALLPLVLLVFIGCAGGEVPQNDFGRDDPEQASVVWDPSAYPPPPYGTRELSVIQNLEFIGWLDPPAADWDPARLERVALSDVYDAEGTEIRFIFMTVVEVWCPWCQTIYGDVRDNDRYATYRAQGVEFFGVLTEDANRDPAKPEDLVYWARDKYAVDYPMVLDPGFKTGVYHDSVGTPLSMLIDARDMRILFKMNGVPSGDVGELFTMMDAFIAP